MPGTHERDSRLARLRRVAFDGQTFAIGVGAKRFSKHSTICRHEDRAEIEGGQKAIDLVRGLFPLAQSVRLLGVSLSSLNTSDRSESPQLALDLP